MSVESLVRNVKEAANKVRSLDILDPEWDDAMVAEMRLIQELHDLLLRDPILATNDSVVKEMLPNIDLATCRDPYKAGLELLFDVVRPEEYLARIAEIYIILPTEPKIPQHLRLFFAEARQCYALGQFTAVQALCRALLEIAVNELGVATGEWTKKQLEDSKFQNAYRFKDRVDRIAGDATNQIYQLYKKLCNVVHGHQITADSEAFAKTIRFVEHLYASHSEATNA